MNRASKIAWTVAGSLLLAIGIAGVLLPLLPGTIFLLGASACYIRGSERLHRWLLEHPLLGTHVRHVHEGRGIPMRAKVVILVMMWTSLAFSVVRLDILALEIFLVLLGIAGTAVVARIRTFQS